MNVPGMDASRLLAALAGLEQDDAEFVRGCKVEWCRSPHQARGYCHRHYEQLRRTGAPLSPLEISIVNSVLSWAEQRRQA